MCTFRFAFIFLFNSKVVEHVPLAGNVKQLQEICEVKDFQLENVKETLKFVFHYGPNNLWLTDRGWQTSFPEFKTMAQIYCSTKILVGLQEIFVSRLCCQQQKITPEYITNVNFIHPNLNTFTLILFV